MIGYRLDELAGVAGGACRGEVVAFQGVSTDTRALVPGQLFVALRGPNHDGHDHLAAAQAAGAAAALVSRPVDLALPQVVVGDTLAALGRIASDWRNRFTGTVVGLTGSSGKTTVKEMIAAVLRLQGSVLATRGNLNNHIGVPLTLCALGAEHRYAVIEMGASACGEIAGLAALARPDVALLNNAGPAHLEGFGGLDGVARGKGEIFSALAEDGVAVLNRDDRYAAYWRGLIGQRRCVEFGLDGPATVTAQVDADGTTQLCIGARRAPLRLALPGRHNLCNALAAAAVASALGIEAEAICAGLAAMTGVGGRMQRRAGRGGCALIDDTYNANPSSLRAAMETVAALGGRRWLVLGDMRELGAEAAAMHATAGEQARELGFERLFALGEFSAEAVAAFGDGAEHHDDVDALVAALCTRLDAGGAPPTLLIKGSRGMRMERVVQRLVDGAAGTDGSGH